MAKKSAKQHEVFTPQGMLPSENWADQTDRPDAQLDKELSAEQTLLHTRQTMSPIAQPAIDVNLMATMQQMLKSQDQLQRMVAAQAAQYEKQSAQYEKQERNNQHLINVNAQLQLKVEELLRERASFTVSLLQHRYEFTQQLRWKPTVLPNRQLVSAIPPLSCWKIVVILLPE